MRTLRITALLAGLALTSALTTAAEMPKSVIHVITLKYKSGITEAERAQLLAATQKLSKDFPGITRVWMKALKVQGPEPGFKDAIVMEFKDQAAFDQYTNHPAHKEWEKVYFPLRESSRTHDITN